MAGVLGLCLAAIVSVVVPRPSQEPPDLGTPNGVTIAYITAIREKRADDLAFVVRLNSFNSITFIIMMRQLPTQVRFSRTMRQLMIATHFPAR